MLDAIQLGISKSTLKALDRLCSRMVLRINATIERPMKYGMPWLNGAPHVVR